MQDGIQAQQGYFEIISGTLRKERNAKLIHDLREYSKPDTQAMLKIVKRLVEEWQGLCRP